MRVLPLPDPDAGRLTEGKVGREGFECCRTPKGTPRTRKLDRGYGDQDTRGPKGEQAILERSEGEAASRTRELLELESKLEAEVESARQEISDSKAEVRKCESLCEQREAESRRRVDALEGQLHAAEELLKAARKKEEVTEFEASPERDDQTALVLRLENELAALRKDLEAREHEGVSAGPESVPTPENPQPQRDLDALTRILHEFAGAARPPVALLRELVETQKATAHELDEQRKVAEGTQQQLIEVKVAYAEAECRNQQLEMGRPGDESKEATPFSFFK